MQKLTRVRKSANESFEVAYQGQNIIPLLLREFESLSAEERDLILKYYSEYSTEHIFAMAKGNKIIPFVADVFIKLGCDTEYWLPHYDFYLRRNSKLKQLLDSIFRNLKAHNCKSVVLTENFGALLASHGNLACFCSGDVDLAADISEKENIVNCLRDFEFHSKDQPSRIGEYSGQSMQFYSDEAIDGGFWINVVWKPVTRAFLIQSKYEARLKRDRLLAKEYDETYIRILENTSLLYFCALHSSAGHYFTLTPGLRLFVDIDRVAREPNIHWQDILDWEVEDEAGIRISMALYLTHKVFKTPIPEPILLKIESNIANNKLLGYLYNSQTNQIQSKSSVFRRLYVELASDNRNLVINLFSRIFNYLGSR